MVLSTTIAPNPYVDGTTVLFDRLDMRVKKKRIMGENFEKSSKDNG